MSSTRVMRCSRAFNVVALAVEVAIFGWELADHNLLMLVPAFFIIAFAACIRWQTKTIRRREHAARPRPDYAAIARMEREVYGEASEEAQVMFAHAELLARIGRLQRSRLCSCGGTLPGHIRSPHYLPPAHRKDTP